MKQEIKRSGVAVMIRDRELWNRFKARLCRDRPANLQENLRIVEALYEEARGLGLFPLSDPLEGIEVDIKVARVVNGVCGAPAETG